MSLNHRIINWRRGLRNYLVLVVVLQVTSQSRTVLSTIFQSKVCGYKPDRGDEFTYVSAFGYPNLFTLPMEKIVPFSS
jgi:hypothetical protein